MRLKRALRWLYAQQPWRPSPQAARTRQSGQTRGRGVATGAVEAAGSGVAMLGEGGTEDTRRRPEMGRPRFRYCRVTLCGTTLGSSPRRRTARRLAARCNCRIWSR